MLEGKKLAVLGTGKLGEMILRGLFEAEVIDPKDVVVTAAHAQRVDALRSAYGVQGTLSNAEAAGSADIVLIVLKPQTVRAVVDEIAGVLRTDQVLITAAAAVTTGLIEERLKAPVPVVRAMPNTPCRIRKGMTAIAPGKHAAEEHVRISKAIFDAVGRTLVVDEKHMDAITGLSASGPAFLYIIIESLAEAGVKVGLPRDIATELAAQTMLGAGSMVIETGEHPARLKDSVTTPAGCTIDGILELEEGGLRVTLIKAVVKAAQRAKELLE